MTELSPPPLHASAFYAASASARQPFPPLPLPPPDILWIPTSHGGPIEMVRDCSWECHWHCQGGRGFAVGRLQRWSIRYPIVILMEDNSISLSPPSRMCAATQKRNHTCVASQSHYHRVGGTVVPRTSWVRPDSGRGPPLKIFTCTCEVGRQPCQAGRTGFDATQAYLLPQLIISFHLTRRAPCAPTCDRREIRGVHASEW